ncbi:MFS transporter [Rhizobium sp. NBRC 114257]|uniref:MFS transporter n=1 Tax=Rhizobium dioscoreae TaxID=2653122 RepID=A0ABQ0Z2Z9_9HYPH|nr:MULTISPECIES: MFS transporter [Rhizobium]GES49908.1 MFS transporter [Rhizobium dioscoreae]GLU84152.1 MFS transporter [Rhizobium sp. NBRC 114257]
MSGDPGPVANAEANAVPPAPPPMPGWKVPLYIAASVMFFLTQGLGLNLAFANLTQIQGTIAATTTESAWLSAAYMAPNVSLAIALVKIRLQYGVRNFAEVSILGFVLASLLNLFVSDLHSAIVVRFLSGIAGAPLSTLGFLYMLEAFEPAKKMTIGVSLAMMNTLLAAPITRLVSPSLLDYGEWRGLYTLEMALALLVMPIIYLLPLTPPPRVKVIVLGDIFSYLLVAIGFGCLAVALSVGRLYWWLEVPWLGVVLAIAVASLTVAIVVELRRSTPLIDVRWLLRPEILHLTAILLVFRIIAAEQTSVIMTFYQNAVGLLYDQLALLYWIILAFSIIGGLICTVFMSYGYTWQIQFIALILMGVGSLMDSQVTNLTRPEQMYLSQALVAAGAALFLPPSMSAGFKEAISKGPPYLVTFFVVFTFTQSIGGLVGSAFYGTLITIREKFHSAVLTERVLLTDPHVATRVSQLSSSYGKVIGDSALLKGEGLALLGAQVSREANMLAYGDAFFTAAVIAFLSLAGLSIHVLFRVVRARFAGDRVEVATSNP